MPIKALKTPQNCLGGINNERGEALSSHLRWIFIQGVRSSNVESISNSCLKTYFSSDEATTKVKHVKKIGSIGGS
jgi:hypothetical protein